MGDGCLQGLKGWLLAAVAVCLPRRCLPVGCKNEGRWDEGRKIVVDAETEIWWLQGLEESSEWTELGLFKKLGSLVP